MGGILSSSTMDKLFECIDIDNNGALSNKEVGGFLYCLFSGCENDNEKKAATAMAVMFIRVAKANNVDNDGEITKQMLEDAEEPELPEGDQADVEAGMKSIFEGIESIGEDGMKEMLGKAAEVSEADMGKFLQEMIGDFTPDQEFSQEELDQEFRRRMIEDEEFRRENAWCEER